MKNYHKKYSEKNKIFRENYSYSSDGEDELDIKAK